MTLAFIIIGQMLQNKKVVGISVGVVVALIAAVGGFLVIHGHHAAKQLISDGAASINTTADVQPSQSAAAGSLGVSSVGSAPTAQNLGQLNVGRQNASASASSSGGGSSSTNVATIDPSTFAQYDKYKDGQHALFGDIQVGNGVAVAANQKVAVYYKGWLTNGTMFDESKAGSDGKLQPFVFQLGAHQVIPGWEEAIGGMKVGSSRLFIIPPAVGYGAQGQASIPGNSVLVFQVQLLAAQ